MNVEYYGNKIINANSPYRWILHRDWKALFFNNSAFGTGGYSIEVSQYEGSCYADTGTNYSEIEGAYFWNNFANGNRRSVSVNKNSCITLVEDSRYWEFKLGFDGTSGVDCGRLSQLPSTCTPGVAYWETDQSCSDLTGVVCADPSFPIRGTLYKCTAPNVWTPYYTPYTYPHPLRDEVRPPPPSGLKIIQ